MSPITEEERRMNQRHSDFTELNQILGKIIPWFVLLGFLYLGGHIAMWYFRGMPVLN